MTRTSTNGFSTLHYEDQHTEPRVDCPNPGLWHAYDDVAPEVEVARLVASLVHALQPAVVIETGGAYGFTSKLIGQALRANSHGTLYAVEGNDARVTYLRDEVAGLPVEVVHADSLTWTPPATAQVAWLDTALSIAEFMRYRAQLEVGALVGFHDCGPQYDVRAGVEQLASDGLLRPIYLRTPRGVILAEVQ